MIKRRAPLALSVAFLSAAVTPACMVGEAPDDSTAGQGLDSRDRGDDDGIHSYAHGVCATGPTTLGVDVSYYDGKIDWAKAKNAGVAFSFIRVSDGTQFKDPKFATDWAAAKQAGVIRGAYQFFRPTEDVAAQAKLFIAAVGPYQAGDLAPVIDVEVTGGLKPSTVAARVRTWVDLVHAGLGVTPIVYSGYYFWRDQVGGPTTFSPNALWLAQYTTACPIVPSPWPTWTFWQYTDTGHVAGIPTAVDMNRFNGSLAQLQALAGAAVDPGTGSGSGSGSGGGGGTTPAVTCHSPTLDKDVAQGTCVQSASTDTWERCDNGTWAPLATPVGCLMQYGWCESATLGKSVPPRTCVQASSDDEWYQCDGHGWVQPTTSTSGPAGTCAKSYPE